MIMQLNCLLFQFIKTVGCETKIEKLQSAAQLMYISLRYLSRVLRHFLHFTYK